MSPSADPELADVQLPTLDLTDLPPVREQARRFVAQLESCEPRRKLTVGDVVVVGAYGSPEVVVRIVAPADELVRR